jgi:NADH-quinone oxidoreductase subunit I
MLPDVPHLTALDRKTMWIKKDELLNWNPQRDVAKPYPPKGQAVAAPAKGH